MLDDEVAGRVAIAGRAGRIVPAAGATAVLFGEGVSLAARPTVDSGRDLQLPRKE